MHLERVGAVFQLVAVRVFLVGKFSRFANRNHAQSKLHRQRSCEQKASRFGCCQDINFQVRNFVSHLVDALRERCVVEQQWSDVFEQNSRLGEIRNVPDKIIEVNRGVRHRRVLRESKRKPGL